MEKVCLLSTGEGFVMGSSGLSALCELYNLIEVPRASHGKAAITH